MHWICFTILTRHLTTLSIEMRKAKILWRLVGFQGDDDIGVVEDLVQEITVLEGSEVSTGGVVKSGEPLLVFGA